MTKDGTLNLIVVCENFGVSYSGGSMATSYLVSHMRIAFKSVHVLCKSHDGYLNEQVQVKLYEREDDVLEYLKVFNESDTVLYGDFYKCRFVLATSFPLFFTYHDNWPEMKDFVDDNAESNAVINDYKDIFSNASMIFSVSEYKMNFIGKHTENCLLVRNGLTQKITTGKTILNKGELVKIVMIGNISPRKYKLAKDLFDLLSLKRLDITIDIFGNIEDQYVYNSIIRHDFVEYQGFEQDISFGDYHLLLNTSLIENLSLSVVDAIANKTPVVAFDIGGLSEVVDSDCGILVKPYEIHKMALAIEGVSRNYDNYYSKNNLSLDFNWENSAKKMVRCIYNSGLNSEMV